MIVKCKFVSVWDDDIEVITDAELDTESGEILNIEQAEDFDSENVNILTDEYIIAEPKYDEDLDEWDGKYFKVCMDCHEHVIGFMGMWDDEFGSYIGHYGCPNCNENGNTLHKNWYNMEAV